MAKVKTTILGELLCRSNLKVFCDGEMSRSWNFHYQLISESMFIHSNFLYQVVANESSAQRVFRSTFLSLSLECCCTDFRGDMVKGEKPRGLKTKCTEDDITSNQMCMPRRKNKKSSLPPVWNKTFGKWELVFHCSPSLIGSVRLWSREINMLSKFFQAKFKTKCRTRSSNKRTLDKTSTSSGY